MVMVLNRYYNVVKKKSWFFNDTLYYVYPKNKTFFFGLFVPKLCTISVIKGKLEIDLDWAEIDFKELEQIYFICKKIMGDTHGL